MVYQTTCASPVGVLTLAADGESLTGLWIEGQKYHGGLTGDGVKRDGGLPVFRRARRWLVRYFAGENPAPAELPLAPAGTPFRQAVWAALRGIPYGHTATYGQVAAAIAAQTGRAGGALARAVGGAVGHNPLSIVIPCHRVVGVGGSLTGYAGGLGVKAKLLEREGVDVAGLFFPKNGTAL